MVGIVLVSHSLPLAQSVRELIFAMTGPGLPVAIAAGTGENHTELGTNAIEIAAVITAMKGTEGVVILMDMGSAIVSSQTALDLLDESLRANVRLCPAPFVEGAVVAGVMASLGAPLEEVCAEAQSAMKPKEAALRSACSKPARSANPSAGQGLA